LGGDVEGGAVELEVAALTLCAPLPKVTLVGRD
jgi:hypothetical protein